MSMKSHGPPGMLCEFKKLLLIQLILIRPGIYLRELQQELSDCTGNLVDISNICHAVRKMGMTRPKIQHIALQQSELKRAKFIAEMAVLDSSTIVWNKTGCDRRNALQKYGYGIRGLTPQDYQIKLRGVRYSAISTLSMEGIKDVYITEGTVYGAIFLDFVEKQLLPILNPFDGQSPHSVVISDNASIHHVNSVIQGINAVGALVKISSYSPDLNPIENVFGEYL